MGDSVLENALLWSLLRETLIMLLEIYALLWKAFRETVLLLCCPIMEKTALLRETVLTIIKKSLLPLSLLFTEHTRWKLSKEIIEISLPS